MKFARVAAFLLAVIAVIFGGATFFLRQMPGVIFKDSFLTIKQNGNIVTYSGRQSGEKILITLSKDDTLSTQIVFSIGNTIKYHCKVTSLGREIIAENGQRFDLVEVACDGSIIFIGGFDHNAIFSKFCTENGKIVEGEKDRTITDFGRRNEYKLSTGDVLEFSYSPQQVVRGSWFVYAVGLIASSLCYLYIKHGITINQAINSFWVKDSSPTETQILAHEIMSIVSIIVVIVIFLCGVTFI